jgi:imidazolonepropionase-like amidohydrolase
MRQRIWPVLILTAAGGLEPLSTDGVPNARGSGRQVLIIDRATVPAGIGATSGRDLAIVIRDRVIEDVGPRETIGRPDGARVIDAGGRTVIPGLIDLHQHAAGVSAPAIRWLEQGVTSVRDPGGDLVPGRRRRAEIAASARLGPRLFLGLLVDLEAGQSPAAVRDRIAREARNGVDLVKLYLRTPPDHARAAIEEAHAHGLPVTWHTSLPLSQALDLGIDGVEHLYVFRELLPPHQGEPPASTSEAFWLIHARWRDLDAHAPGAQRLFRQMAERLVVWTPTLVLHARIAGGASDLSRDWSAAQVAAARAGFDAACHMVGEAHRRGVAIGAGTDTGDPADLHEELALLVRCGLTPAEALRSATLVAARALRRERSLGAIARGALADLVILDADPTRDIDATRRIWLVVADGRVVPPIHAGARRTAPVSGRPAAAAALSGTSPRRCSWDRRRWRSG